MIEASARMAVRRAGRLYPVAGYTRDDALQDARIGAWRAMESDWCADDAPDRAARMALAGYRNILDGRTSRWKQSAGGAREQELTDAHASATPCTGAALAAARQMLAAIERMRHPLPTVAGMLIEGYELAEIGARLGVSETRIHQHRRRLQTTLSQLMGLTT